MSSSNINDNNEEFSEFLGDFFDGLEELESGKGDCVVAVRRGKLDGVQDVLLLPVTHWSLAGKMTKPAERRLLHAILDRVGD